MRHHRQCVVAVHDARRRGVDVVTRRARRPCLDLLELSLQGAIAQQQRAQLRVDLLARTLRAARERPRQLRHAVVVAQRVGERLEAVVANGVPQHVQAAQTRRVLERVGERDGARRRDPVALQAHDAQRALCVRERRGQRVRDGVAAARLPQVQLLHRAARVDAADGGRDGRRACRLEVPVVAGERQLAQRAVAVQRAGQRLDAALAEAVALEAQLPQHRVRGQHARRSLGHVVADVVEREIERGDRRRRLAARGRQRAQHCERVRRLERAVAQVEALPRARARLQRVNERVDGLAVQRRACEDEAARRRSRVGRHAARHAATDGLQLLGTLAEDGAGRLEPLAAHAHEAAAHGADRLGAVVVPAITAKVATTSSLAVAVLVAVSLARATATGAARSGRLARRQAVDVELLRVAAAAEV
mmetsp:Transcript_14888/g.51849  ORF Transcript_14888/g.51849 Transcript_14888/m.51849 type:complete len:419 (-) Transcript_14888:2094-3350(-)